MPGPPVSTPPSVPAPGAGDDRADAGSGRRPPARLRPRCGRWGCLAVVLVLAACLALWRRPVLQGMAAMLVVDEPAPQANCVLIGGGDGCFDVAAATWRANPSCRVLLMESPPGRLVRLGVLPTVEQTGRRALQARGVPPEAVEVIARRPDGPPTRTGRLEAWLEGHPDDRVLLLCDRFEGRQVRCLLDRGLGPAAAARVAVGGLPDRRYDETNWWRSRQGAKQWVLQGAALAQAWCCGEPEELREDWDPDEYERALRARPAGGKP